MKIDMTEDELRARRGVKWSMHGADVLPAWVADMDFRAAPPVERAINGLMASSDLGYAARDGVPLGVALGRAFASRVGARFGWTDCDPSLVLGMTDLVQGIFDCVQAYSEPGDEVVVQGPTYDPFREGIEDSSRVMSVDHMVATSDGWQIDFDQLRDLARRSPLLLLCHPHNPTGRAFTREELTTIAQIAIDEDLIVASDEIWADFVFGDRSHVPLATLGPEIAERTVTMYSAGKSFTIAGLRCAQLHFGSETLKERFHQRFPPRMLGGLNVMGYEATVAAWRDGDEWFEAVFAQLEQNIGEVERFVERFDRTLSAVRPESTYLYWIDCSGLGLTDETPADFFRRHGVALSPGSDFGVQYSNFVRLNFATSSAILAEILQRMGDAMAQHLERT